MILVTGAQMQALDRRTITEAKIPGLTLMERAGKGVVEWMVRVYGPPAGKSVVIMCGKGNNGGDGFVVARHLKQKRAKVAVVLMAKADRLIGDAKTMYKRLIRSAGSGVVHINPSIDRVERLLGESDWVVDALLGTGLSSPVTGSYLSAIQMMNSAGKPVAAVDLPSGIHADTGAVLGDAVRAALTVTFGQPKLGLYTGHGIDHAGRVEVVDIGIPDSYVESVGSRVSLITQSQARQAIPSRRTASHKGTYGHVGIVAGSLGKTGAAALAAKAALRSGAGLVTIAAPAGVVPSLQTLLLEVMAVPMPETEAGTFGAAGLEEIVSFIHARSAGAIGPGLTTHPETVELVRALIPRLQKPCILDADALNALSGNVARLAEAKVPLVLTPHPGEMARLIDGATTQAVNADRIGLARQFAGDHHVIMVLKGARTVVAHPDGRVAICPTGNPGMATAGSGDALTGMIASLLAQGQPAWESACAGTYLHGLAGDLAAAEVGPQGMIAGDLIDRIPRALSRVGRT